MVTTIGFKQLTAVLLICIVILFWVNIWDERDYTRTIKYTEPIQDEEFVDTNITTAPASIEEIIKQQRNVLSRKFKDFPFPGNLRLEDFTLASGGQPVRSIIVTTWRSGSTFLGDVLNALPGNYYHYEPLLDYGIMQIRGPPWSNSAINNLKYLLQCDYHNMKSYIQYGKQHVYLFTHNTRLWSACEQYPKYCWNSTFLSEFCKLYPFQSMKVVRLRAKLAEALLEDEKLNVKVLLLIRDPRGTLQSRKHRDWCPGVSDCDQPNLLCADMVSDYSAATYLQKKYPDRFRAIRYEDLSLDPYKHVQDLFDFFGLPFHRNVVNFLDSHTKANAGGVSSTFRDSKSAPFHWRMDLNFSEVQNIEENCEQAMKLWGYARAKNETHLREFNPVTSYVIE